MWRYVAHLFHCATSLNLVAFCLLSLFGSVCAEEHRVNRLSNGSFEDGLSPWGNNISPATTEIVTGDPNGKVRSGRKAVRLRNEKKVWAHFYQSTRHPEGRIYELSFWARAGETVIIAGQPVQPAVEAYVYEYGNPDREGGSKFMQTTRILISQPVTDQWRQFKLRFTNSQALGVRDFSVALGMQGEVVFDDAVLNEINTLREARILYLPFDGSFSAKEARGAKIPEVRGQPKFVEGKQGQAGSFTNNSNLIFDAEHNFDQAEGTLAMWIKPYWPNDDGIPHCFFEVPVGPALLTDGGFVMTKGWSTGVQPNLSYFYNSPGHYHISGFDRFEANEWVHVAFSWSASKNMLQLFRNGELVRIQKFDRIEERPASRGRVLVVGARLGGKSSDKNDKGKFYGQIPRQFGAIGGDGADAALDELMVFNRILTAAEVSRLVGTKVKQTVDVGPREAAHVNRIEARLETPHLKFASPLAGGPINAFFVGAVQGSGACRDVVELAQRMDVDFSATTTWYPWMLGYAPAYLRVWQDTSVSEKADEIMARLAENPEVIVIANVIYSKLPRNVHDSILGRVRAGAGLVVTAPRGLPAEFEPGPPAYKGDDGLHAAAQQELLITAPLDGLPEFFPDEDLSPSERGTAGVRTYRVGKGRVVVIRWEPDEAVEGEGWEGLAPLAAGGRWTRQYEHRYNYHLGLFGTALRWAAGRDPRAKWTRLPDDGQRFQHAQLPVQLPAINTSWHGKSGKTATFSVTIRDPLGREESQVEDVVQLNEGLNALPLTLPRLMHGLHFLELLLSTDDGVENWATVSFHIAGPENITAITTRQEHYERGEMVQGDVRFAGPTKVPAALNLRLRDTNGRVYNRIRVPVPVGSNTSPFEIAADRPTTLASYVEADLVRDGQVIAAADTVVFVPKRNPQEYLSVLWCDIVNGGVGQVALRQARAAGFNAVYHWAGQCGDFHNDAMADLMPVQYCTRITLRPDTRGWPQGFIGDGRLDPKFQEFLKRLQQGVQASKPLGPPYYTLGDENHFQFGFGYSPYEIIAFHQFLERRYGTIERLNEEYVANYRSFEEVPRYQEAKAIEQNLIPALIDHRLGTDDEWANYHRDMVDAIREVDPQARVGAEGSEAGDMERMLRGVQLWGPYGDDVQLRSLASKDHLASHWDAGPTEGSAGVEDCTKLWSWLIGGFVNYYQFFCALHVDGAMFNVDYSYRPYFAKRLPELKRIFAGPAPMMKGAHVTSDAMIAVHWSRESEHASLALKSLGTTQSSRSNLVKSLQWINRDFRYITSNQMVAGGLETPQAKILFLPATYAISREAAARIVAFVEQGGTVIADFLPPLNEYGRQLPEGQLDELFGATCAGKSNPVAVDDLAIDVTLDGQSLLLVCPRTVAHADLRTTTAESLASADQVPLFLVNQVGRGKAILLNFDLARCSRAQRARFVDSLLHLGNTEPRYRLTAPPKTQFSVLRRGDTSFLGVIFPQDTTGNNLIAWNEPAHVYDVRSGKYLGKKKEIPINVTQSSELVHLFALEKSPVTAIQIQPGGSFALGKTLTFQLAIRFLRPTQALSDRLVRIDLTDPQGKSVRHYRTFVTLDGTDGNFEIPFAENDLPGRWTVTATDVATGVSSETAVILED